MMQLFLMEIIFSLSYFFLLGVKVNMGLLLGENTTNYGTRAETSEVR